MINVSYKRDFYQESQKKMNKLLNMNRDHCNLFMMCIPNFSDVDSDIKKLTRIRITCVRRGLAIIQTPVNSLYSTDKWDQMNNERTERKWATSSARRPRYGKLTTYKGYLRFNDLPEDMREKYKAIKREKRNELIIKQEKDSLLPSTEIELFVQRLKAGKISEELLTEYCVIKGSKLSQFKSRVNTRLKDVGDEKRIKDYLTKPKKVLMKNSYPGL